jgi:hypothetical protein
MNGKIGSNFGNAKRGFCAKIANPYFKLRVWDESVPTSHFNRYET